MAGTAAIFRIDAVGDTEVTARTANQIVEFGTGAINPDAKSHASFISKHYIRDVSIHPNPNRELSAIQDGKLGTIEVIIRGFVDDPSNAGLHSRIDTWMTNAMTNAALPFGRIGIRWDNSNTFNLTPSATIGYILFDYILEDVEEFQNKHTFTLRLFRNGSV